MLFGLFMTVAYFYPPRVDVILVSSGVMGLRRIDEIGAWLVIDQK